MINKDDSRPLECMLSPHCGGGCSCGGSGLVWPSKAAEIVRVFDAHNDNEIIEELHDLAKEVLSSCWSGSGFVPRKLRIIVHPLDRLGGKHD